VAPVYKIHPSIGIARLGNSDRFYIGPEAAGALPTDPSTGQPVSSFRDAQGRLLKQAARFRVFRYDDPGDPGTEVEAGSGGVAGIAWTVHLANKKAVWYQFEQLTGSGMEGDQGYLDNGSAINPLRNPDVTDPAGRQALILDPGARSVGGPYHPRVAEFDLPPGETTDPAKIKPYAITTLGSLLAEQDGSLLVLGASGSSGTTNLAPHDPGQQPVYEYALITYANNDGWFDDTADGPVSAVLVMDDGSTVPVGAGAWCLCVPPAYAPQVLNQVTLWDTMYDVAVRELDYRPDLFANGQFNPDYLVDYATEILPMISRPNIYQWVADIPSGGVSNHAALPGDSGPQFPLGAVRTTAQVNVQLNGKGNPYMPFLAGDNPISNLTISQYLSLTQTQYFLLSQWVAGKVSSGPPPAMPIAPGDAIDKGVLENCVGGAFCPGIEMTWISRNPTIYAAPFRLGHALVDGPLSPIWGDTNDYSQGMQPGDATKYMAQPWQSDFNECSIQPISNDPGNNNGTPTTNYWWWPAQRPWYVYTAPGTSQVAWDRGFLPDPDTATYEDPNLGDMQMVEDWKYMGFILGSATPSSGQQFLEIERLTSEIDSYQPPRLDTQTKAKAG
jgi:L-lysine epsilon oxidase-like protein